MSEEEKRSDRAELEERLIRHLPLGAAALIVVITVIVGSIWGPSFGVLVLAVGAMLAAVATLWNSLRALFGETPLSREDAFAIGAPSAEEEQKRAVLRAIKDLEFEHGVGKISSEDYQELVTRYRAEAKRLLRTIDEHASPERERVERLVARHLRAQGIEPGWLTGDEARPEETASESPVEAKETAEERDAAERDEETPEGRDEEQDAEAPAPSADGDEEGPASDAASRPEARS